MHYTYVLLSRKDGKLYIGYTPDLPGRIKEHSEGRVRSTSSRRPLVLIYYEACLNKRDALKRERYFKMGFGRRFLKNRLEDFYRTQARLPTQGISEQARDGGRDKRGR